MAIDGLGHNLERRYVRDTSPMLWLAEMFARLRVRWDVQN